MCAQFDFAMIVFLYSVGKHCGATCKKAAGITPCRLGKQLSCVAGDGPLADQTMLV
jgi:hypothetical protein